MGLRLHILTKNIYELPNNRRDAAIHSAFYNVTHDIYLISIIGYGNCAWGLLSFHFILFFSSRNQVFLEIRFKTPRTWSVTGKKNKRNPIIPFDVIVDGIPKKVRTFLDRVVSNIIIIAKSIIIVKAGVHPRDENGSPSVRYRPARCGFSRGR